MQILTRLLFFFFLSTLVACVEHARDEEADNNIVVHYIANEGFLLESSNTKVLIDALFNTGLDRYACPDSALLSQMVLGKPPFEKIDYLFFTHNHPDHFNDSLVIGFLEQHPESIMICPDQVFDQLNDRQNVDETYLKQILVFTPDSGQVIQHEFDNLVMKACRTRHSDTYNIENNAYILDFGGVKIFHSGDSWKEALNEWNDFDLKAENIDLALVNGFYAGDGFKLLNDKMSPHQIILIHMKNEHLDMFADIMAKDTAVFHNATLFKKSLESKEYQF
jgi:L-ascorbate metabolism protein UlaG (beta-lactamase superfamily)